MVETASCGGIVIYKSKVLLLYKNRHDKYVGWVLPKGTKEKGESLKQTAAREVSEEAGVQAEILKYVGKTRYTFRAADDVVNKTVYWYLMAANSFYCKPQAEEFFSDAGFYKRHEAYQLLKYHDEKQVLEKACADYDAIIKDSAEGKIYDKS